MAKSSSPPQRADEADPLPPDALTAAWRAAWPEALAAWSSFTQLREPAYLTTKADAKAHGMAGELAAIRLRDQVIAVNLHLLRERGLERRWSREILAHEIGHHVYVPGNLTEHARLIAAMRRILVTFPVDVTHMVANLYADLLVNDRLQRRPELELVGDAQARPKLDFPGLYRRLGETAPGASAQAGVPPSQVWLLYLRICDRLWLLPSDARLTPPSLPPELEADALFLARLVRSFAADWLRGARRFASVLYPYLLTDQKAGQAPGLLRAGLHDTRGACGAAPGEADADAVPDGLAGVDPTENADLDDFEDDATDPLHAKRSARKDPPTPAPANTAPTAEGQGRPGAQFREPHEYGELLKALGLDLDAHEVTTRYYRERALPHLLPFPARRAPRAREPLAEGQEPWTPGEPLEAIDWLGSVLASPHVIPGVTTVQPVFGDTPGADPAKVPVDLDIYVDCSGSMPNPAVSVSYLALAGAILALSALRVGARVQATLWSGARQFDTTGGFVREEKRILGILTGYLGGGTAFPLHLLRDTYEARKPADPPAHIVVISDDGADTILLKDEKGTPGAKLAQRAFERARGGGTFVLNLPAVDSWKAAPTLRAMGFRIHPVQAWEDLVAFARAFVRETYEGRS
ncbi:MAG: VWA domain-containing protein [Planctomycetes bacterium]|nr:VWA domain-containing protein [Planctomycetota bacterium]